MLIFGFSACEWLLCHAVYQASWCLSLALQWVSSCYVLLWIKLADDACPWPSRMWVTAVSCCVSSLLMRPVLGSSGSEWLLCLAVYQACWWCLFLALQEVSGCCVLLCIKPADDACSWLSSMWVAAVSCCVSSLLMMPVLGSPEGEWLLCLALYQACWWCLFLALQNVSGCCVLLCIRPADDACPWLFSMWVAAVSCCVSSLLMMPVLGSPGSEWLLCLAVHQACWWHLSLALQPVSDCCVLLSIRRDDNPCPWLFRLWVTGFLYCISILLIKPVIDASGSEWHVCLAVFQACWQYLFLTFQPVSGSCVLSCFKPAADACSWLFRQWVLWLITFQAYWWFLFLTLQHVNDCCTLLHLKPADNAYLWLTRKWVAAVSFCVSTLLILFNLLVCEWLLCLLVFQACCWCLFLAP